MDAVAGGPVAVQRAKFTVETGGPRLHIEAQALQGLRVGDDVHIAVPRAGAWAIRPSA